MNRKIKGFLCGAIGAASYGMNPLFTLPLYQEKMDADSVLLYRYALAIAMLAVVMKLQRIPFALKKKEILPAVAAGLLIAVSSLTLFLCYRHMDAGIASTLLFIYPAMVALIMAFLFHEKLSPATVASITLALAGIGLLCKGGDGTPLSLFGLLLVMLSSFTYAVYMVLVNRSSLKEMPAAKLSFYALLFGLSVYIVRLKFCTELQPIPSLPAFGNLLALAFLPTVISFFCMTLAIHCIGATPAAILGALEPVTAIFFGVLVFGEQLTPRLLLGILLIIFGVSIIIAGKTAEKKLSGLFTRLFARAGN